MESSEKKDKNIWWREAFEVFVQISGWIVGPIIIAVLLGQWLDERYQKEPCFFVTCVTIAFIVTNVGLIRMVIKTSRKMEKIISAKGGSPPAVPGHWRAGASPASLREAGRAGGKAEKAKAKK